MTSRGGEGGEGSGPAAEAQLYAAQAATQSSVMTLSRRCLAGGLPNSIYFMPSFKVFC